MLKISKFVSLSKFVISLQTDEGFLKSYQSCVCLIHDWYLEELQIFVLKDMLIIHFSIEI